MSYAYPQSSAGPYTPRPSSYRNQFVEPPSLSARAQTTAFVYAQEWIDDVKECLGYGTRRRRRKSLWQEARATVRAAFCVANFLVVIWMFTLWWGERTVFQNSLSSCFWDNWEKWPVDARPHHVVFVADPQLVDPHTYPGRPWPLSSLTVRYTDQYLRRSFSMIEQYLVPDSIFFLGDLFDGGREWSTTTSKSPEERYRKYDDNYWRREYDRFARIFFRQWNQPPAHMGAEARGRKLIASLPGNHDLGFGSGVQDSVRRRFQAYFGRGNRVDVVGNHTFVSVDTVSLSAMDQPDPETGSTGTGAGDGHRPNEEIWGSTEDWLEGVKALKARRETEELRAQRNVSEGYRFEAGIHEASENPLLGKVEVESQGLPTVLLTHVPLYRRPATPCGPLRERYPPATTNPMPEEDEGNALKILGGYQYQNVLTPTISNELISKVGPEIAHVYSGDDHDYCEIAHREFSGSPKEITVKSLSWAMGVRYPGFLMTTLWNPIDLHTGNPLDERRSPSSSATIQNHLCLMPDQLSVFIRYGLLFFLTVCVLLVRAICVAFFSLGKHHAESSVLTLPYIEPRHPSSLPRDPASLSASVSSATSAADVEPRLANRTSPRDSTIVESSQRYQDLKRGFWDDDEDKWKTKASLNRQSGRGCVGPTSSISRFRLEFQRSVKHVALLVLPFYVWLIWTW